MKILLKYFFSVEELKVPLSLKINENYIKIFFLPQDECFALKLKKVFHYKSNYKIIKISDF
jgi:hypothetical protein